MNFIPIALLTWFGSVAGDNSIVQTYFIPFPEEDLFKTFKSINNRSSGQIQTLISVAVAANKTVIFWDHWEDGYETDPSNPIQASTEIWGAGLNSRPASGPGSRPLLRSGDAIVLENLVPVSGDRGDIIRYDGRDRISATLPIAVTRSAYPEVPGPLLAGAVEVFAVQEWGTEFVAPVRQQVFGTNPFEYAAFTVMAGFDVTEVTFNGNTTILQSGESLVLSPLALGQSLSASRPIQVDLIGGDVGSNYEIRWYAQVPAEDFSNEYYSPVAETVGNTGFWFFNPNVYSITVDYQGGNLVSSGQFEIPGGGEKFIEVTSDGSGDSIHLGTESSTSMGDNTAYYSGLRFSSKDKFYGLVQVDARAKPTGRDDPGTLYDWGFPLIPSDKLTSQVVIGLGKGCKSSSTDPQVCKDNDIAHNRAERSVVFLTPVDDTKIFVDYEGDGTFDTIFDMNKLDSLRLTDTKNNDFDMTGAIIASFKSVGPNKQPTGVPVKIAVAWGQDPVRSGSKDEEALDMGTVVLPLANPFVSKSVINVTNPDGTLDPRLLVDQVGDIIFYEITITNVGFAEISLSDIIVLDPLITNAGGLLTGPVESIQPPDLLLLRGETFTYFGSYLVKSLDILNKVTSVSSDIENIAEVKVQSFRPVKVSVKTPVVLANISGSVFEDTNDDDNGDIPLANVLISLFTAGNPTLLKTTLTDSNGFYSFFNLEAGMYDVVQTNLPVFVNVKDADGGNPNEIKVSVVGGNHSLFNDFVDERLGSIGGTVENEAGIPIPGVLLELLNSKGTVVATSLTDASGAYKFSNLGPSNYTIRETNDPTFSIDVSDYDTRPDGDTFDQDFSVDNLIKVSLEPAEFDDGNKFVDNSAPSQSPSLAPSFSPSLNPSTAPSVTPSQSPSLAPSFSPSLEPSRDPSLTPSISPSLDPTILPSYNPSTNPSHLPSLNPSSAPSIVTSTEPSFSPSLHPSLTPSLLPSISPSSLPSLSPSLEPSLSPSIALSVAPSSSPTLVPSLHPSVSPSYTPSILRSSEPSSSPSVQPSTQPTNLPSYEPSTSPSLSPSRAPSILQSSEPSLSPSLSPSLIPSYSPSLAPSVVRSAIPSYSPSYSPSTVDSTSPSLLPSVKPTSLPSYTPSILPSVLTSKQPSLYPSTNPTVIVSSTPSLSPSVSPSVQLKAPPIAITAEPSISPSTSPSMSDYCVEVATPNCTLCIPYRSPDYCKASESFPSLIRNRTAAVRSGSASSESLTSGYWFQYLENKIAGYILSLTENVPAPEIFCCVTNVTELSPCLSNYFNKASIGGIVVKATSLHSSTGVFVLLPDPVGPDPLDLITGTHVSLDDIVTQLSVLQVTTIIVEQFIGKDLPTEYKFHVVNGTVAAIDVISGRGTDCPCYAVRDVDWNPLDKFGCFEPSGIELVNPGSQCTAIDFPTGLAKKGPVKKDLYLCVDLEEPEPCVLQEMIDIAIKLGSRIGVYVRIDMFAVGDRVYVQEYSTNHMNGIRHCAAKQDEFGCIDSCFLGRLWNAAGGPFGGVQTQVPPILSEFDQKSAKDQCSLLDQKPISYYTPKC